MDERMSKRMDELEQQRDEYERQAYVAHEKIVELTASLRKCEECGTTMNFIGLGLHECWKCTEAATRQELVKVKAALKVYATESMWVQYERDDEITKSLFVGNEDGVEDGVLCDGWRFALKALGEGQHDLQRDSQTRAKTQEQQWPF